MGVGQAVSVLEVALSDEPVKIPKATCEVEVPGTPLKVCAAVEGRKSPNPTA